MPVRPTTQPVPRAFGPSMQCERSWHHEQQQAADPRQLRARDRAAPAEPHVVHAQLGKTFRCPFRAAAGEGGVSKGVAVAEEKKGIHRAWLIMVGCCILQGCALGCLMNSGGIFFRQGKNTTSVRRISKENFGWRSEKPPPHSCETRSTRSTFFGFERKRTRAAFHNGRIQKRLFPFSSVRL